MIAARPLEKGWTGKANALWTGVQQAQGLWLLFTDADTVHAAGSTSRAVVEADRYNVAMLSWSPRQLTGGLLERMLMPLVFSELAIAYPSAQVNDPERRIAAANGQFLLIGGDAYRQVGGHAAVAGSLLEDMDLAARVKRQKLGLRFRHAPEMVSARMYRGFGQMWEGWTKNLALLIDNAVLVAAWRMLDVVLLVCLPGLALYFADTPLKWIALALVWLRVVWRVYRRAARSHFPAGDVALSCLGLPLLAALLYASWFCHTVTRRVSWKGREYPTGHASKL